eukprot:745983-Hanusia_phi.AAC.1
MLKFLKRESGGGDREEKQKKRREEEEQRGEDEDPSPASTLSSGRLPLSFLSWNANSLVNRCKEGSNIKDWLDLVRGLQPDVIALQEVRMVASAPPGSKRGDGRKRDRGSPRDNDKECKEELMLVAEVLNKEPLCDYVVRWSLADWRYAGTALLVRKDVRRPVSFHYNLDLGKEHDENGRVIMAKFAKEDGKELLVVNAYAPNNGWKEESNFAKRREWDAKLLSFVRRCKRDQVELAWLGDLNVAHRDCDVTHPDFFRSQRNDRDRSAAKPSSQDAGQPGFTQNEQERFSRVLEEGGLVDTFRLLHRPEEFESSDDPAWTWRGSAHLTDKYHNRGMRIDYCLLSSCLAGRVRESRVIGHSRKRENFFGSDHSPIFMALFPEGEEEGEQKREEEGEDGKGEEEEVVVVQKCTESQQVEAVSSSERIRHEPESSRFVMLIPGVSSEDTPLLTYTLRKEGGATIMDMQHTFTPPALRGRGIAEELCVAAFQFCSSRAIKVIPSCSYIRDTFLGRRKEFLPQVV